MKTENLHIAFKTFFKKYADEIREGGSLKTSILQLDQYPLLPSQAIYVTDLQEMTITYQRGIEKLLGYSVEEFNFDMIMQFYHPDDFDQYMHFVKIANEWVRENKVEPFAIEATFDYRIRKKDGLYLKVLRQSTVFETLHNGLMKSSFSILSDISKIKFNTSVNLSMVNTHTGRIILEESENPMTDFHFTQREIEILKMLKQGMDSREVALQLVCSKHTIDTHRRKMLQKSGCKSTIELINLCTIEGII